MNRKDSPVCVCNKCSAAKMRRRKVKCRIIIDSLYCNNYFNGPAVVLKRQVKIDYVDITEKHNKIKRNNKNDLHVSILPTSFASYIKS